MKEILTGGRRMSRGVALSLFGAALLLFTPALGFDFQRDPRWNDAYSKGQRLYLKNCAACHGRDGEGGLGLPLNLQSFLVVAPENYIKKSILYGRPGRLMPAFEKMLKPEEVEAIVSFVRSWQFQEGVPVKKGPVKGDPENGRSLFQGICTGCHGLNGEGGPAGLGGAHITSTITAARGPALNNQGFLKSATDGYIKATLMYGRVGTPMGAYLKGRQGFVELTEQEINDIVAFIRSWEKR